MTSPSIRSFRLLAGLTLFALLAGVGCTLSGPIADADADETIRRLEATLAEDPEDGITLYVLARHWGRNGDTERALAYLERLADSGWDYALEHHDFEGVADEPRYAEIRQTLAAREPEVGRAAVAFEVGKDGVLSEGMAWDEATGRFFLGAAEVRRVLVVEPTGAVIGQWPPPGEDEGEDGSAAEPLLAPLGMDVDPVHRRLWVATAAAAFMTGYDESLAGRSALVALDLGTGAVVERFEIGSDEEPVLLNDLAVLPDGRVAVTDTAGNRVLVADPATDRLEPLTAPEAPLFAPNGIALPPNEPDHLIVATYHGLARLDFDGSVTPLPNPPGVRLGGIDGLEPAGDHLIGIQNLPGRPRIWALSRPDDGGPIVAEILMSKDDRLGNPTTGAYVPEDHEFYYMANPFGGNERVRMLALPFFR